MKARTWGECVEYSGEDANQQRPGCSSPRLPRAGRCRSLQGFQKRDQGVSVGRGQGLEAVAGAGRLAAVCLDRLPERRVPPVVQERLGVPEVEQRLGAELGRGRQAHADVGEIDRKSTRLNSSHGYISYAVFCLK